MDGVGRAAAGGGTPLRARWAGLAVLALGLLAGTGPACSAPLAEGVADAQPVVQADVFSGRPNPEWSLESGETSELRHLLGRLRGAERPGRLYDGLGYRGFVVFGTEGVIPGCDELRVQAGQVVAHCGGGDRWYADPDRALERWLAETAEGRTEADVARLLRQQTRG
ncbi:MAG TPA: hypothetical protein VF615_26840 [Longimicrobiaceae bacterium]